MAEITVLLCLIAVISHYTSTGEATEKIANNSDTSKSSKQPRKGTVYINNEPVMVDDEELKMIKDLSLKKGLYFFKGHNVNKPFNRGNLKAQPSQNKSSRNGLKTYNKQNRNSYDNIWEESPSSAVNSSSQKQQSNNSDLSKSYRFVADPDKAYLIENVSPEEMEEMRDQKASTEFDMTLTTGSKEIQNSSTKQETATVQYQKTNNIFLQLLFGEFHALSNFLKQRNIYGNIAETFHTWYLWIMNGLSGFRTAFLNYGILL